MSDEAPTPGNFLYRVLDYSALGCILIAPEELARGGITGGPTLPWRTCFYFFAAGVVILCVNHFGLRAAALVAHLVDRVRNSEALSVALAENLALKRQLEDRPVTVVPTGPRLHIHRAVYGLETVEDMDVADKLRGAIGNALAIRVNNDLVPRDPAHQATKRLEVDYSYGTNVIKRVSRPEYELLVLPEDSWLAKENQNLQKEISDLENQIVELKRPPAPRLTIQSAHYGKPPGHTEDVTLPIQRCLRNNKLNVVVSAHSLDLPLTATMAMISVMSPGPMFLRVVYSLGDLRDLVIVRSEGERLELPE